MKRIRRILRRQDGMALILVLCIFALLMALSLSVLAASAATLGNANSGVVQEQSYLTAKSFSGMVKDQLLSEGALKDLADSLADGAEETVSGTVSDIGDVTCVFHRKGDILSVVVTSDYREQKHIMKMSFQKLTGEGSASWAFQGYIPNDLR